MSASVALYIHGLESGPNGTKARRLAEAGYSVRALQMPCNMAAIRRDPALLAVAVGFVSLLITAGGLGGVLAVAGVLLVSPLAAPLLTVWLWRRAIRASLAVQRAALAGVDVVVASSFGGAIAHQLIVEGAWSGPTVLLCPASNRVAARAWWPPPAGLATVPCADQVLVVHGRADEIVPFADSEALVAGSTATLLAVDDDHRLSATATADGLASWCARVGVPTSAS